MTNTMHHIARRPGVVSNLHHGTGLDAVAPFIEQRGLLRP